MERRLFGTDGVRGTANIWPMTAEMALRLGQAAGRVFVRGDHRHRVVIAKDTRLSGYMIEPALTAGFVSAGMDVMLAGPLPTPAAAFLTRTLRADLGVVISASHNPYQDNGIKLFGPDGFKLSDAIEVEIERAILADAAPALAGPAELGRALRIDDAHGRYVEYLKSSFPRGMTLAGLKIAVDCANGAAYHIAPDLFWELGAEVVRVGTSPNGFNINHDCGSTHPENVARAVLAHGADLGIALDGDADRVVMVDEHGQIIDGDQVLALIATQWQEEQRLTGGGVVATLMSNLGLETYLADRGLPLLRTKVGDRYVVERMRQGGYNLGGEQSGHIIMTDFGTTGDGLLAALQVLAVLLKKNRPVSEVARPFTPLPQKLSNVRVQRRIDLTSPVIEQLIKDSQAKLGRKGRLLVRASGTEPLIRVMVEAEDEALLSDILGSVSGAIASYADSPAH
ncbi:phosphoglucosamine mutase [Geminicoccus flavidas]|uniref:phosphoglucosamine mutase n=1 Tax=Geminicoccus flavidas TaxID=2506407 RepID=UPI00135C99B1|nr:phosphoglucosamine mutase [Geminicoccus flavidas]